MNNLVLRDLRKNEESEFRKLTSHYIGKWYDDIDESFSEMIINAHFTGHDPIGYFTKAKRILAAELDREMVGFAVATEKRGGSVKIAPIIVTEENQRKGIGRVMLRNIENEYRKRGARKLYTHFPTERHDLLRWFLKEGFQIEAQLVKQYRKDQDDFVVGKLLQHGAPSLIEVSPWRRISSPYTVRDYNEEDFPNLKHLILNEMRPFYDEIDEDFIESIVLARERFNETFKQKGKKVFITETYGSLSGFCVATPKRGGAVKLSPLIIDPQLPSRKMAGDLISKTEEYFTEKGFRKLYTTVPLENPNLWIAFRRSGFSVEGLLREPYKSGINNLVLGKLIG